MRKLALVLIPVIILSLLALPYLVDWQKNQVFQHDFPPLKQSIPNLLIVDLHSDQLLWNRNLLTKSSYGHVDLPRLQEGKVAIQVFSSVTKTPFGLNYHSNSPSTDSITLLSILQGRPLKTWNSLLQRSLFHSELLHKYESLSNGQIKILKSKEELNNFLQTRKNKAVGAILAIEGAHALEGHPENLDILFDAGFRMIGLAHFFDNEIGGSAHGEEKGGLSPFGFLLVQKMNEKNIIIDLAHASEKVIDDVLNLSTKPIVISHTGVRATCDGPRNLTDIQLKKIAENGGLVGIGFWKDAVCGEDIFSITKAIGHAIEIMGVEHVALGSDFDGAVPTVMDSSKMAYLTESLLQNGLTTEQIEMVMGKNAIRFLQENLP